MTRCYSCGSTPDDGPFPVFKPGVRRLCCDCISEARAADKPIQRPTLITRAQWRARLRVRQQSPQLDLVDFING